MSRLLATLALALPLAACGGGSGPPQAGAWPEGTAVALGPVPIPRAELERVADALGEVNPVHTRRALLREALVAQLLPRAAARQLGADRFEEARARAERGMAVLRGEAPGPRPEVHERSGYLQELGFDLWNRTLGLEPGVWAGPFEGVGSWLGLRLVRRWHEPGEPDRLQERFELEWVQWPFLPPGIDSEEIQARIDSTGVTVVEPDLAELVPYPLRRP